MCAAKTVVIYVLFVYLRFIIIIQSAMKSTAHFRMNIEILFD
jgi:hypothetical protein